MKKPSIKALNSILAAGMLCLFIAFILIIGILGKTENIALTIYSLILCLVGLVFVYLHLGFARSPFKLFIGFAFTFNGAFLTILSCKIIPIGLSQLWPLMMIFTAFALNVAGRSKQKKFDFAYDAPAICLVFLGIFFLLFSLNVIHLSFGEFALFAAPVILIIAGIFLIVLFSQRKALLEFLPDELSKEFNDETFLEDNNDFAPGEDE